MRRLAPWSPLRVVLLVVGSLVISLLVALLPAAVAESARAFLLLASGAVLLLVALALFLLPARRLLASVFGLPLQVEGRTFGLVRDEEMRTTLSPLVVAGVCLGVALLSTLLRG